MIHVQACVGSLANGHGALNINRSAGSSRRRTSSRTSRTRCHAAAFEIVEASAREHGQRIYQELVQTHRARLGLEREKGEYAFAARRRALERIGLPAVRDRRLTRLAAEERAWREALDRKAETSPELEPLLLLHVEGGTK